MSDNALTFTESELKLLREKSKKLTQVEFDGFLAACTRYQLNPLANQIYARLQPETEKNPRSVTYCAQIDGYRLIADRTGAYAGNDDPVYDNENTPRRATAKVYKLVGGQRCAFEATARWDQYFPGERQGFMWRKMPHLMLGKCAEGLALRKAFPAQLSGLYTLEEMHQVGDREEVKEPPPGKDAPNPFRQQAEKRKPAANGARKPPKKTSAELIKECDNPTMLALRLKTWLKNKPLTADPQGWQAIVDTADLHAGLQIKAGRWNEEDADQVTVVLRDINEQLATLAQAEETFA